MENPVGMKVAKDLAKKEELANALSHMAGAALASAGLALLVVFAAIRGNAWHVVTTSVFGGSMVILYISSSIAHWLRPGRGKDFFFFLDHIAIFLLIAGTYTPLTLLLLKGGLGWTLFGVEWGLAMTGIILKFTRVGRTGAGVNYFILALYAIMTWMFVAALASMIRSMPLMGWLWVLIGIACYTAGVFFYRKARFPFHHLVWHLLVIAGSVSHWFAIFFYLIP